MEEDQMEARLKPFVIDSNEALELKLIRKEEDIENEDTSFSPEMSHQVFGDRYYFLFFFFIFNLCQHTNHYH